MPLGRTAERNVRLLDYGDSVLAQSRIDFGPPAAATAYVHHRSIDLASRDVLLEIHSYRYETEDTDEDEDPQDMEEEIIDYPQSCLEELQWRFTLSPSSYLQAGQTYVGKQKVSRLGRQEDWAVRVKLQDVDLDRARLFGTMWAQTGSNTPVMTFFEGEIIDNRTHSFVTTKWGANRKTDRQHWSMFHGYKLLEAEARINDDRDAVLRDHPYIFMRWKELFFVDAKSSDTQLTIAGFYYICLSRHTGHISGYYFDTESAQPQKLDLENDAGLYFSHGEYHFN
eukprot:jgi/Botrbrau1/23225/Bobra.0041s0067.1